MRMPSCGQRLRRRTMRLLTSLKIIYLIKIIWTDASRPKFSAALFKLTEEITSTYFRKFRCVTYVTDEGETEVYLTREKPVFIVKLRVDNLSSDKLLTESFEQGCGGYVIQTSNNSRRSMIRSLIAAKHKAIGFRYNTQRYLFLPVDVRDTNSDVLEDGDVFYLPDLVVVTPRDENTFLIRTHTVFDHHKHDVLGVTQEVLDVWSVTNGFERGADLYPDKLKNVNGKKFVFAVVNYSPFSLILKEGNRTVFDGFETRIAGQFVEIINGTWEGLDHPVDLWGELFPNGTGTGIVGSVKEHKADFGFSAFYQWFCEDYDCTYPFYQSAVTCLVPKPRLVSGWLNVIIPFDRSTWLALIIAYFLSSAFVFLLLLALRFIKGSKNFGNTKSLLSDSYFTVFRLQLEQIPRISKRKEPLAVYVKIAVFYYFFVAAFWQGGIASNLTVPRYESPIDQTEDLVQRWPKIQWGANTNAWINSIKASSDPNLVEIVKKFMVLDDETLAWRTRTSDFGFFIEELPHGLYGYNDYINEESMKYLRRMEGNIYSAFGVLILPKGSPYSEKFDRTLFRMFDTGIVHKIEVQVSLDRINNRLQNMIRFSNENEPEGVTLAVRHIEGPLFIYLAGTILSAVVFIIEKLVSIQTSRIRQPVAPNLRSFW